MLSWWVFCLVRGRLLYFIVMAENKKSFLLYTDVHHTVKKLSDEQAGKLFKHILSYVNDENPCLTDILLEVAFEPIKQSLKRDLRKYETIREKRSLAGKASAEKRQQVLTSVEQEKQVEHVSTNPTVNVSDSVSDSDSDNGIDIDKEKNTIPPPIFLIEKYCKERNNGIDANYFYDWYQTRGWKVGKDKMKDWQSAIRTWEKRNEKKPEAKLVMP